MKKLSFLLVFLSILAVNSSVFGENITLLKINALPKNINLNDAVTINNAVMENLLDMNQLLNNSYINSMTLEKWVNTKIEMINATNTNRIVVAKRTLMPKKLRTISLKSLAPTVLKTVNKYVTINGILLVNFISKIKTDGTGTINITFTLYNNLGLKIAASVATIPLNRIQDSVYLSLMIKEAVITAYNIWPRYYYNTKETGSVTFNITPRKAKVYFKLLDRSMTRGKNDKIPYGSYNVLVSASNYITLLTNLTLSTKSMSFKAVLQKFNPASLQPGAPPVGNLYLDADYPNAKFTIIEDGISGRVPALLTNIRATERTIVFDETPEYALKNMKVNIKENDTIYEIANLAKKGSGFNLICNVDGAVVILDKEIIGTVSNGSFSVNAPSGLHVITVVKDKFEPVRTNMTLTVERKEEINITMNPKKVPGLVITPQSDSIPVYVDNVRMGTTPASINLDRTDNYRFLISGTNMGFYNLDTNMGWDWNKDNNLLAILKPLYGDARIFVTPEDSSVAIDGYYRGKAGSNGLMLYQVPSKVIKLRAEKDGFRTFTTNVYIIPNIENQFSVVLKEAPAKAYVTTSPEKGFDVFVNGDFVGISGEGVISLEFGGVTIKARKRGFKTLITNIVASNRNPIVINFTTSPGMGEEEFVEEVSAVYREGMILVDNYDLDGAVKKFTEAKGLIDGSGLEDLPSVMELTEKINFQLKRYSTLSQVKELEDTGDLYMDKENYDEAIKNYQDAVGLLDKSEIIKINQSVQEMRKAIFQKYKKAERLKIKPVKWWPMMTRNWSGFGFDLGIADISRRGPTVLKTYINLPSYFKARWNFLPIMGIQIGGMYNFWYPVNLSTTIQEKFLFYALLFGANLRLPLLPSWAFFGEYNFAVSDFSTFNVLENGIIDVGFDLKFGWFGVKLFYEIGFKSNFSVIHHGFGGGVTLWLTEE